LASTGFPNSYEKMIHLGFHPESEARKVAYLLDMAEQ
jgi:hypothetical protein